MMREQYFIQFKIQVDAAILMGFDRTDEAGSSSKTPVRRRRLRRNRFRPRQDSWTEKSHVKTSCLRRDSSSGKLGISGSGDSGTIKVNEPAATADL